METEAVSYVVFLSGSEPQLISEHLTYEEAKAECERLNARDTNRPYQVNRVDVLEEI